MALIDTKEAQTLLTRVNEASLQYGMEISKEKTQAMLISTEQRKLYHKIDEYTLKQVESFKYVGSIISANNHKYQS